MKHDSIQKIVELFTDGVEVISFDVFDTLLVRPLSENGKFHLLEKKFWEISGSRFCFERARKNAEIYVRKKASAGGSGKEDVTIDEIYDAIADLYSISRTITDEMKAEEFALERKLCRARNSGKYLYEKARAAKKRILAVSDMYLSEAQIGQLLEENGYPKMDKIYVSSRAGVLKATGNLYRYVLRKENLSPEKLLHIGDNRKTDCEIPSALGIHTAWLPGTLETYHRYGCSTQVEKICRDLTNWESAEAEYGIAAYRQMAANRYFDDPFRPFDSASDYNCDPYFVGYGALGMEILSLTGWLIDRMRETGADRIYFLSRDGYLPLCAYRIFEKYDKDLPKADYLYTSRIALLPIIIRAKEDLFDLPVDISYQTPRKLLGLLEFCDGGSGKMRTMAENGEHSYRMDDAFKRDSFCEFISDFIRLDYDAGKHEKSRQTVRNYFLSKMGKGGRVAVFDMGYSGRIAGALKEAAQTDMDIYFFHTDGNNVFREERLSGIKVRAFLDFSPYMESTLREYAYLEPVASCIGYTKEGEPFFDQGPADGYRETVMEMQKGCLDFVSDFMRVFHEYLPLLSFRFHNGAMPFEAFLRHCSVPDRQMFANVRIDDELWGGRRDINLKYLMEKRLEKMPDYAKTGQPMPKKADHGELKTDAAMGESALTWYPFQKESDVLLVNRGEYEFVPFLQRRCGNVTQASAFDGKPDGLFDYVVCVDALDDTSDPAAEIRGWFSYLKKDGKLLLLCDNRYGLKYFCGASEKHTGIPYMGVNGYYVNTGVCRQYDTWNDEVGHSYSRKELMDFLKQAGIETYKFFYPLPDARMPQMVYTDDCKNGVNCRERLLDYDYSDGNMRAIEHRILPEVIEEGTLPFLANSFFIEIPAGGDVCDIEFAVMTTDRGPSFGAVTAVHTSGLVSKRAIWKEGEANIRQLFAYTKELAKKGVPVVEGELREDAGGLSFYMPRIDGEALSLVLDRYAKEAPERFVEIFDRIFDYIRMSSEPGENGRGRVFLDLAPCNCFFLKDARTGGRLLFYDQEFVDADATPEFAMYRVLNCYFESSKKAQACMSLEKMYERYGITPSDRKDFHKKEQAFIKQVRNKDHYQWIFEASTPDYERMYKDNLPGEPSPKPYHIGYVPGVFDLFHTGHLRLLERCKERCDRLIVGVLTDELVEYYKGKKPVISFENRVSVIKGLRAVDRVIAVDFHNTDKLKAWEELHYDCHFSGDDHVGHWDDVCRELKKRGSNMEFFSYTQGISSTKIREDMKRTSEK